MVFLKTFILIALEVKYRKLRYKKLNLRNQLQNYQNCLNKMVQGPTVFSSKDEIVKERRKPPRAEPGSPRAPKHEKTKHPDFRRLNQPNQTSESGTGGSNYLATGTDV